MARLDKTVTIVRLDWAVICSLYGRSRRDNIVTLGMIMLSMHGQFKQDGNYGESRQDRL